jgi:hypothetical protein
MVLTRRKAGRGRRISEFEASLIYRVSSRTARAIQRNPVWKLSPPPQKKKTSKNKTKQTNTRRKAQVWMLQSHLERGTK